MKAFLLLHYEKASVKKITSPFAKTHTHTHSLFFIFLKLRSAIKKKKGMNTLKGVNDEEKDVKSGKIIDDRRFNKVHYEPRFKNVSKKKNKVKIDSRFAKVLQDSKNEFFDSSNSRVDKYGRLRKNDNKEKLDQYYELDCEHDERGKRARGIKESSESSSDLSDLNDDINLGEDIFKYGPLDDSVSLANESEIDTRLAIVDLDWDNVNAAIIFKILSSFLPSNGSLISVEIYKSDFGKERLEEESEFGPPKEIFVQDNEQSEEMFEEQNANSFDQIKLRKYLLERLKYYYSIAQFDTPNTAKIVYYQCNNTEIEHSSNILNLRVVPSDTTFDDDPVQVATKETLTEVSFENVNFVTSSLQSSKPRLLWDEDEDRVRIVRRKFTEEELENMDLKTYLASPSSSDEEISSIHSNRKKAREKYLSLLSETNEESSNVFQRSRNPEISLTFKPLLASDDIAKNDELELLALNDNIEENSNREHYSSKEVLKYEKYLNSKGKLKSKRKKSLVMSEIQPSFKLDTKDERFSQFFHDEDFSLDPTSSKFKPSKSIDLLLKERKKKLPKYNRSLNDLNSSSNPETTQTSQNSASLLESFKKSVSLHERRNPPKNLSRAAPLPSHILEKYTSANTAL